MKTMIFLIPAISLLLACEKENEVPTSFLPGKWNLVKTELFENGTLTGVSEQTEVNTVYYFYDELQGENAGQMYIEEDGEQQLYSYHYDDFAGTIRLDETTSFTVDYMSEGRLRLSRTYGNFRSTYAFIKES